MNTRSFLKSLAIACVAPQILIPRAPDAYQWVQHAPSVVEIWMPEESHKIMEWHRAYKSGGIYPIGLNVYFEIKKSIGNVSKRPVRFDLDEYGWYTRRESIDGKVLFFP